MDARSIVIESGMSDRPGYYGGRGATLTDLDSSRLEEICNLIEREHGKEAVKSFVQMVANIPKLSANNFLVSLYNLEANDWKYDSSILSNKKGIYIEHEGEAMGTVLSVLGGMSERNESRQIRGPFLDKFEEYLQ